MQKCSNCGKEIRYIASAKNICIKCDAEEITVYTQLGRKVEGFKIHECQKGKTDGTEKE